MWSPPGVCSCEKPAMQLSTSTAWAGAVSRRSAPARSAFPFEAFAGHLRALRLLSAHPEVDAKRVALMGFSHGGTGACLHRRPGPRKNSPPAAKWRFELSFRWIRIPIPFSRSVTGCRLQAHPHGAADDWTPAKPCADLVASLKASGRDPPISVYADAYHSFDQARDTVYLPNVVNPADC